MNVQRILVADDDPVAVELLQVYLEARGYDVSTVSDGNRALVLGGNGEFALLILDVHMPFYGG